MERFVAYFKWIGIFGLLGLLVAARFRTASSISYAPPQYESPEVVQRAGPLPAAINPPRGGLPPHARLQTIILHESNTVLFRGPITMDSVAVVGAELLAKSQALAPSDTIRLVLDTPGGDVTAGGDFIDLARSIPQRVETVTIFAASMGFHVVQALGERLITPHGELMSHRISVSGLSGQLFGSLDSVLKAWSREANEQDSVAATRMGLSLDAYHTLVRDEYWVRGFDAVADRAADRVVRVTCDSDLSGTHTSAVVTPRGPAVITVSDCPLLRGVLSVDFKGPPLKDPAGFSKLQSYLKAAYAPEDGRTTVKY